MGSGRRLLRNESGSLRDVMNCDRSSLRYNAFRSSNGEDDRPIGRCVVDKSVVLQRVAPSLVPRVTGQEKSERSRRAAS